MKWRMAWVRNKRICGMKAVYGLTTLSIVIFSKFLSALLMDVAKIFAYSLFFTVNFAISSRPSSFAPLRQCLSRAMSIRVKTVSNGSTWPFRGVYAL